MKKKISKKEYEREIMRRMAEETAEEAGESAKAGEQEPAEEEYVDERDSRKCPRCLKEVGKANICPHCGYNGYIPMSKRSIMRTRLILWPILLATAIIIYLVVRNK